MNNVSLSDLESILQVKFNDPKLLQQALTHRSFLNEDKKSKVSNERLEFLGDSVLSILVSTELFERFSTYPEGKLTSLRSALVRAKTLGEIAASLKLGEFLFMSKGEERGGGRENNSLLADTFEAVLGAIYLDSGIEEAGKFVARNLFPLISDLPNKAELIDYKSLLQEVVQEKQKTSPQYQVLSETGPDHDKVFKIGAFIESELMGEGSGKSKQEAEQAAAARALEKIGKT